MVRRLWNVGSWGIVIGAAMLALIAWSPALRMRIHSDDARPAQGRPNDFTLPALDGRDWTLAQHRGQVVLVNCWATWCPPCRAEMPELVALQAHYTPRGFQIVGVNMDQDESAVAPFVNAHNLNYPVLLPRAPFALAEGVDALPTSILIDRQGRVARRYIGMISEAAVRDDIEKLLADPKTH